MCDGASNSQNVEMEAQLVETQLVTLQDDNLCTTGVLADETSAPSASSGTFPLLQIPQEGPSTSTGTRADLNQAPAPALITPPYTAAPTPAAAVPTAQPSALLQVAQSRKRHRKRPLEPEEEEAKAILDRVFARYAKSIDGVKFDHYPGLMPCFHFDEATHPRAPSWPPSLCDHLVQCYVNTAKTRDPSSAVSHRSVVRFVNNLKKFYFYNRGEKLSPDCTRALTSAAKRVEKQCGRGRIREYLTTETLLVLSSKVWSHDYNALFRQRFDITLFISLTISTGQQSKMLLSQASPTFDLYQAVAAKKDGVRWRDFRVVITPTGPLAFLDSRIEADRTFCLNGGSTIGLSTSLLVLIGMYLDGVIAGNLPIPYLLSDSFLQGRSFRQVQLEPQRSWFSVFRSDGSGSGQRRSAMNAELRRLSRLAQFEHDVTTGSLRGFVARKVYEHHNPEITSAMLGHPSTSKTAKYLSNKIHKQIDKAEHELGSGLPAHERQAWSLCSREMRTHAIQSMPDLICPSNWLPDALMPPATPTPPTPSPAPRGESEDPLLTALATWMTGPASAYPAAAFFAPHLARVQNFWRTPAHDQEQPPPQMPQTTIDDECDEESYDSDDSS